MKSRGFTLTEVLVGVALLLIIFLGIFGAYQLALKVVSQSKARMIAIAIANQKIEQVQNLPYQSVGVIGGSPDGTLEPSESVIKNEIEFLVSINVDYITDEADGLAAPEDECIYDYKRARVTVSWLGRFGGEVSLATDIAPKNEVQECEESGGILWAKVFDAYGEKISGAQVNVEDILNPEVTKQCLTTLDKECYIALPTSLEGQGENYKIVVTKDSYSQDQTFGTNESYNSKIIITPKKPNVTILEGQITELSFAIDRLSSFSIQTKTYQKNKEETSHPIKNVPFNLEGLKTVGTDSEEEPIYKYSASHISGPAGQIDIPNLEWDSYNFSVDKAITDLDLIETEPGPQPVGLEPNVNQSVILYLEAENTLLAEVKDADTGEPIFSASVRLYKTDFDETQFTNEDGETFFIPLEAANYNIEITAEGYESYTGQVSVSDDTIKSVNLTLSPQ